jgi:hypothetical protein
MAVVMGVAKTMIFRRSPARRLSWSFGGHKVKEAAQGGLTLVATALDSRHGHT